MKKILLSLALIVSLNAFSQNWLKVENQLIKVPDQKERELSALKARPVCTYDTDDYSSLTEAETAKNTWKAQKTDVLIFSEDWVPMAGGEGPTTMYYHYTITYYRPFGSCY